MSETEFTRVWNQENRSPFDFPSQYDTIYKWVDFIKPVISKPYDYTPMSVSARAFIDTKKKSK
jgi:hypothetical protein